MITEHDEGQHVKEVYARFGLALYHAQVLEHGLVNSLVFLDLVPSRGHRAHSRNDWGIAVDAFMDRHFETTMGRMMKALRDVAAVSADVETVLADALRRRNWLAHDFFRERATEFMSIPGREQMLHEVDECRACFEAADERLDEIVRPLRIQAGITDELIAQEYQRLLTGNKHVG